MDTIKYTSVILNEIDNALSKISHQEIEKIIDQIIKSERIFVAGMGRSGLAIKAFAIRLMHMGFSVYVVGETITPNIKKNDLLLIGSGSGETNSLIGMSHKCKKIEAILALITTSSDSTIGQLANIIIQIPAYTPKSIQKDDQLIQSIQPMGNLFEQSLFLLLDSIILKLMNIQRLDSNTMFQRHANLE